MVPFKSIFWCFLVCSSSLWCPGQSQDLHRLREKIKEIESHQAVLKSHPDFKSDLDDAKMVIEELWSVHFPTLLENPETALRFTNQCRNSTYSILMEYLKKLNISAKEIPIPMKFLTLLDATGKHGAGLLEGNLYMNGAFDECFDQDYTGYCEATKVNLTFVPSKLPLSWTVGLCVPKHCSSHDVSVLINSTMIFKVSEDSILCRDSKFPSFSLGAIVMLIVSGIFIVLVIGGTLVHVIYDYMGSFLKEVKMKDRPFMINDNGLDSGSHASERTPLLTLEVKKPKGKVSPLDFITAFSLYKTVPTLLATKQSPTVITSLNGMRVISMFWVILCHANIWVFMSGADNVFRIRDLGSRLSFQAVINAFFSVDSFFFLSGTLVAYLTLREMKKRKGVLQTILLYFHYYVHRYLRLTPTYAFVLFFTWFLTNHLAAGPTLYDNMYRDSCTKYWWTNFLYINNFYPWRLTDECLGWTWYLANDMQFFIITPLILIPLYLFFPIGLGVATAILIGGFVVTAALVGVFDFQSSVFAFVAYNYISPDIQHNYSDMIYIKPWARISPYLVGIILGFVLFKKVRIPFRNRLINACLHLVLWVLAGIIMVSCLYGLVFIWHGHTPSKAENILYITFSRFAWGVGLALIVFACHNGYGGFINTFLSMKMWTPLSRMTFNAYLVHPVVLTIMYGQLQTTIHYTDITMASYSVAAVVFSYGVAGVICLFVEFPLGTIEILIFKLFGLQRDSQRHVNLGTELDNKERVYQKD